MDAAVAEKLANESGNGFQCRVANYFRDKNWAVTLSPYYVDSSTDKTREADLIVEYGFPVPMTFAGNTPKSVRVRLFIECKYVTQGVVFWFDSMDDRQARNWIHSNTCIIPSHVNTNHHHYLNLGGEVAKLFTSERAKGEDADPMFRTINQCLSGFLSNRSRPSRVNDNGVGEEVSKLDYPVVVCSTFRDYFYRTEVRSGGTPSELNRHFALEVDYAYINSKRGSVRDYFLADILAFDHLDGFLGLISREVEAAISMVRDY
jgi:hypothetical protein